MSLAMHVSKRAQQKLPNVNFSHMYAGNSTRAFWPACLPMHELVIMSSIAKVAAPAVHTRS